MKQVHEMPKSDLNRKEEREVNSIHKEIKHSVTKKPSEHPGGSMYKSYQPKSNKSCYM